MSELDAAYIRAPEPIIITVGTAKHLVILSYDLYTLYILVFNIPIVHLCSYIDFMLSQYFACFNCRSGVFKFYHVYHHKGQQFYIFRSKNSDVQIMQHLLEDS